MKVRGQKGQSTVELALTILIFLAMMVVLADMVKICYEWVSLQFAVNEGARFGSLGETSGSLDREASIEAKVVEIAGNLGVSNVTVSFVDDTGGGTPGAPLTFYRLQAQTPVSLNPVSNLLLSFVGNYANQVYNVTAETLIRNEPFSP